MKSDLSTATKQNMRTPYALRRVPEASLSCLLAPVGQPRAGDVALAELERIGRNASLELSNGRRCALQEGDLLAVVFGNRYATMQFEGYARGDADRCDLNSTGVLVGVADSKNAKAVDPRKHV